MQRGKDQSIESFISIFFLFSFKNLEQGNLLVQHSSLKYTHCIFYYSVLAFFQVLLRSTVAWK